MSGGPVQCWAEQSTAGQHTANISCPTLCWGQLSLRPLYHHSSYCSLDISTVLTLLLTRYVCICVVYRWWRGQCRHLTGGGGGRRWVWAVVPSPPSQPSTAHRSPPPPHHHQQTRHSTVGRANCNSCSRQICGFKQSPIMNVIIYPTYPTLCPLHNTLALILPI